MVSRSRLDAVVKGLGIWRYVLLGAVDAAIWMLAVLVTTALRHDLVMAQVWWVGAIIAGAVAAFLHVSLAWTMRLYSGRHRLGSIDEAIVLALVIGFVGTFGMAVMQVPSLPRLVPLSVPLAATVTALAGIMGTRVVLRRMQEAARQPREGLRALIVGAGDGGTWLVKDLLINPQSPYLPVGFVDDDPAKAHYRVGYVCVLGGTRDIRDLIESERIDRVLVAAPSAGSALYRIVTEQVQGTCVRVKVLPSLAELVGEGVALSDLRDLDVADLLGRHQVSTDLSQVASYLADRRILVTGAGGSIGSELCRQIHRFGPGRLGMLDRDESALHSLQLSIDGRGLLNTRDLILADIRDLDAIRRIMAEFRPQVMFHAAALKHLPMLQMYPEEGWKTNVLGTHNVLTAAAEVGVEVFVNISTDKAADPSSVLGATKRAAERLTAHSGATESGTYVSVRFGNVLGSRGSVLTAFTEQIRRGGPLTVTDAGVTRYFMTIPEAVQLVLQAGAIGVDGEVMVLDMGRPVSIQAVAEQLIAMSGGGIDIIHTGLRPGEKMHEVLASPEEELLPTPHPLISHVRADPLAWEQVVEIRDEVLPVDVIDIRRTGDAVSG